MIDVLVINSSCQMSSNRPSNAAGHMLETPYVDVPLFVLKAFDRSIQMDGVFKMDDDYLSSMDLTLISPCSLATSYQSRTDIERRCLRLARMPRSLSESG